MNHKKTKEECNWQWREGLETQGGRCTRTKQELANVWVTIRCGCTRQLADWNRRIGGDLILFVLLINTKRSEALESIKQ